jgi:hypothetical protein
VGDVSVVGAVRSCFDIGAPTRRLLLSAGEGAVSGRLVTGAADFLSTASETRCALAPGPGGCAVTTRTARAALRRSPENCSVPTTGAGCRPRAALRSRPAGGGLGAAHPERAARRAGFPAPPDRRVRPLPARLHGAAGPVRGRRDHRGGVVGRARRHPPIRLLPQGGAAHRTRHHRPLLRRQTTAGEAVAAGLAAAALGTVRGGQVHRPSRRPDHAYSRQVADRLGGNRAALSVVRKIAHGAHHTLRALGGDSGLCTVSDSPVARRPRQGRKER